MVAVKGDRFEAVPLKRVAGLIKSVPEDHQWTTTGRLVGRCFGD
jgi:ATP-dependent phosphofructokinase / diphosphate-dependent phosphofructokinase